MKNYGFIPPEITDDNYVLGGFSKLKGTPINPTGQWLNWLPDKEVQSKNGIETYNCTAYGTLSALEILFRYKYGLPEEYSDRALGIASGTGFQEGNSPHTIAETLRKELGCVPETALPFSDDIRTRDEYFQPNPLTSMVKYIGKTWLSRWAFGHEWIFKDGTLKEKQDKLKHALTVSPLGVSVRAWEQNAEGLFTKEIGAQDSHWCALIGYKENEYWIAFDSYDGFIKHLIWDYDFGYAKAYYVDVAPDKISIIKKILDLIGQVLNIQSLLIKKIQEPIPDQSLPDQAPNPPPAPPTHPSRIVEWARAMEKEEGSKPPKPTDRSKRNNNPGNLKYTSLTASFGAVGKDPENFCIYPDYPTGFNALCSFLRLAAEDQLIPYKNARTLKEFISIYALPPNDGYANNVASELKVAVTTDISELL